MRVPAFFIFLFISFAAFGLPLRDRLIQSGPHAGKKLFEAVSAYSIPGQSGDDLRIPTRAINESFNFFDRYSHTNRRFQQKKILPFDKKPHVSGFISILELVEEPTIGNQKYIAIFDLNQHASKKRLHVINTETGEVISAEVSHGRETDCGGARLGWACRFISDRESLGTPLGFFATGEMYNGEHGLSLRMNGLEGSQLQCTRNRDGTFRTCPGNVLPTTIIIHSADYVEEGHAGRSHGCVSVSFATMAAIRNKLKNGALFYFFHDEIDSSSRPPVSDLISADEMD